jgi:hypothetical protein
VTAQKQTQWMLRWWRQAGIHRADLAVKPRTQPGLIWHQNLPLDSLPLAWARFQNVRQAEIYIRPARGYAWPLVFLDDVAATRAGRVAHAYDAIVVETSPAGGCHIWLACRHPLQEKARRQAQRWLVPRLAADPASVSGEHLGRLAGFKNWKRGGNWVNVLHASAYGHPWDPALAIGDHQAIPAPDTTQNAPPREPGKTDIDTSPSGREWGWVCGRLEDGWCPDDVYERLLEKARPRRGADAQRYARRTLERALHHIRQTRGG